MNGRRVAVIGGEAGGPWGEERLVVNRLCGALACHGDVDLLVEGPGPRAGHDGAVAVRRFPAPRDVGEAGDRRSSLGRHLAVGRYDLVVAAGFRHPASAAALRSVPEKTPVVAVPLARLGEPWHGTEACMRAARVVVTTEHEGSVVRQLVPELAQDRVRVVGSVVRVNDVVRRFAVTTDRTPSVVVAADWEDEDGVALASWCDELRSALAPGLVLRCVGPGSHLVPGGVSPPASGRTDAWRWILLAVALVDPRPARLVGREVLESMLLGTPVIVPHDGGATRVHAEAAGGSPFSDLPGAVNLARKLLDPDRLAVLRARGRKYVEDVYGDPDDYIERVRVAILDLVG